MIDISKYLAAIFLTTLFVHAFEMAEANVIDTVKVEEVVVTGSHIRVNRNNVPMAVSVVGRSQIEDTNESALLPVLNGRVPGLFVTERGVTGFGVAAGAAGQISIRGVGGSPTTGVLMLIDGHPQFMGIMGHPLPDSYVASDAERVEVIRGPASILYGSNAMGGVINIITKKQPNEGLNGNARLSYGSFNTQKYMASAGYRKNGFSTFISGNHDRTDGHREHSDFKIYNGYAKFGYEFNDNLWINTDLSMAVFEAADPGPDTLNAAFGQRIDITRGYWSLSFQNEYDRLSGAVKLFYNFGEHDITDGFHSLDHNYGINIYESLKLFRGTNVTVGVDYMNYGGLAENLLARNGNGIVLVDTTVYETGIYSFVQQDLANGLILNAGIRRNSHSVYGNRWIPSAGFAWQLSADATIKGNVSQGFRSPTIRELFLFGANPALSPETIINYEAGISKYFFNRMLNAEITLYQIKGDNLIVLVPMQGHRNAGEVNNKGVELQIQAQPSRTLRLEGTYSHINMKNPVFATPKHHLFLSAHYTLNKIHLMASLQQINGLDSDPSPAVALENYSLLMAKAVYRINEKIKWYVSGENLLNQAYSVNRYYSMPGTTIFSGLNISF
jgi:outer membrane cobalamin receptor